MAYTPTYEEFEKALKASGLGSEFSPYDLALAREDPAAGMSILSYKQDWHRAKDAGDSLGMTAANNGANVARAGSGNYSGGAEGRDYYSLSPEHRAADALQERMGAYGSFVYDREPDYRAALDAVTDREPFVYDPNRDPVYGSYKKAYIREGRRASEDTLGQYAAMTGGRPGSAAVTAAQQAGNAYAAGLADKLPELYEQAYQRYLNEYSMRLKALNALAADRSVRYGEYGDTYDRMRSTLKDLRDTEDTNYRRALDQEEARYQRERSAEETAYRRKQEALDRARQEELDRYGREREAYADRLSAAKLAAQYGDLRGLRELGIDPNTVNIYQLALAEAGRVSPVGSGGSGSGSGSGTSEYSSSYTAMREAGIRTYGEAVEWLKTVRGYSDGVAKEMAKDYMESAGNVAPGGEVTGTGNDYRELLSALDRMSARGATYRQFMAELDAELRDGNISQAERDDLLRHYTSGGLEDGVSNLSGAAHRNGLPMSQGFAQVWKTVRNLADRQEKDKALETVRQAADAGTIHEYEIDIILDQLGW